jgi:hypothetical protein
MVVSHDRLAGCCALTLIDPRLTAQPCPAHPSASPPEQKLTLCLKATLDNITSLQPQSEQHEFHFRVQCSSCHEEHPNTVPVNQQVSQSLPSEEAMAIRPVARRPLRRRARGPCPCLAR